MLVGYFYRIQIHTCPDFTLFLNNLKMYIILNFAMQSYHVYVSLHICQEGDLLKLYNFQVSLRYVYTVY